MRIARKCTESIWFNVALGTSLILTAVLDHSRSGFMRGIIVGGVSVVIFDVLFERYVRNYWRQGLQASSQLREQQREQEYQELLSSIWLYVKWDYVTKQLTTAQKDMWADAIDACHEKVVERLIEHVGKKPTSSQIGEAEDLYAFVSRDRDTGTVGLKQGFTNVGLIPLVSINQDRLDRDELWEQLGDNLGPRGETLLLVRYEAVEVIGKLEPS